MAVIISKRHSCCQITARNPTSWIIDQIDISDRRFNPDLATHNCVY